MQDYTDYAAEADAFYAEQLLVAQKMDDLLAAALENGEVVYIDPVTGKRECSNCGKAPHNGAKCFAALSVDQVRRLSEAGY